MGTVSKLQTARHTYTLHIYNLSCALFTMLLQRTQPKSLKKYKAQLGIESANLELCKNQTVKITIESLHISTPDLDKNQQQTPTVYQISDLTNSNSSPNSNQNSTSTSSFSFTNLFGCRKQKYKADDNSEMLVEPGILFDLIANSKIQGDFVELRYNLTIYENKMKNRKVVKKFVGMIGSFAPKKDTLQSLSARDIKSPAKGRYRVLFKIMDKNDAVLDKVEFILKVKKVKKV